MDYDWSQFKVTMYYRAPRARVFDAWATPAGLASFFIKDATHVSPEGRTREPAERIGAGDRYTWAFVHDYTYEGEMLEVVEGERLRFTFGGPEVSVTFRDHEGATEVVLHQTGCATEDPVRAWQHLNCRSCWIYFMTNLRSVLANGTDLRDHEHPNWNDSVSIGWVPGGAPA